MRLLATIIFIQFGFYEFVKTIDVQIRVLIVSALITMLDCSASDAKRYF